MTPPIADATERLTLPHPTTTSDTFRLGIVRSISGSTLVHGFIFRASIRACLGLYAYSMQVYVLLSYVMSCRLDFISRSLSVADRRVAYFSVNNTGALFYYNELYKAAKPTTYLL